MFDNDTKVAMWKANTGRRVQVWVPAGSERMKANIGDGGVGIVIGAFCAGTGTGPVKVIVKFVRAESTFIARQHTYVESWVEVLDV